MKQASFRTLIGAMLIGAAVCTGAAQTVAPAAAPARPQAAVAASPPAAAQKVAEVEGITEYRLANGLRVLLFPDQSKPTITVNVTYLVGSRHESYGETGMAHLLEHMLFKGTKNRADVAKEFNARGARFNGSTSLDRTNYYEMLQASDDNLGWALGMEADRMVNSLIARKDLDTEMTVVRNEYERGENDPENVLFKRLQSIAYDWHNYGNATIGNRSDIENVDIKHLQDFYRLYYQPDNAVLLVAGKFDAAKALQLVSKSFGVIPRPKRVLPKLWTVEPTQDGERSVVVRRVGDLQVVIVAYRIPSVLHADSLAMGYAGETLGSAPSGRLHKALVETGKATEVSAGTQDGVDGSLFVVEAVVKKGDPVEPVRDEMIRIVEDFASNPPSAAEMERTRIRLANAYERTMTNHESIGLGLSEYIALGDWRTFFLQRDEVQKVTAAQVQAASRKYLLRDNRTVGLFLPEENTRRADIPATPNVGELVANYKPKAVVVEAETFDSSPENIEKRVHRLEIGGMKIALLSKKNRGETVNFTMSLPAGDEKTLFGKDEVSALTGAMMSMGTTRYTREQLRDEFAKLKISGGVSGQGASFQTTGPNLVSAISLVSHVLKNPAFPAAEFEQLRKRMITSVESSLSDPEARASEALDLQFNIYPKGDPRYASSMQETLDGIKSVTLDDVKQFHKTFYSANHALIAIVGDFNEEAVTKALRDEFSGWHNDAPWKRITREYRDIPAKNITIDTPDKENATFLVRMNLDVNQNDPDYASLLLADYILGGGAGFDSRLTARIRVKEGLSYGVSSSAAGAIFDRAGSWNVQAIAAPQNVAKVEAAMREELDKVLKDGFTADEIAKAKSGWAQKFAQNRAQDGSLASRLVSHLDSGRTLLTWDKAFEGRMAAVTPESARAALRKFLDPKKLTIVKAGDFAKAAKSP